MRYDLLLRTLPVLLLATFACGHGSMKDPVSRVYSIYLEGPEQPQSAAAQAAIAACGTQPFYDWHELVNFHPGDSQYQSSVPYHLTIPDGRLASADNDKYDCLDMLRDDWPATQVVPGPRVLTWYASTPHDPSVFRAWLTTPDWNPATALNWNQMEELDLGEVTFEGLEYSFETVLPEREGRHVLYVIWQRIDPVGEGFYAACDLVFGTSDSDPTGACCMDDGCTLASAEECIAIGGDWEGEDVLCSESSCGQIGQGPDSVSISLVNSWSGGYEASMTVANSMGDLPMFSWNLSYESGPAITKIWNAELGEEGADTVIFNAPWNGHLEPGESTSFGLTIEGDWPPYFHDARLNGFHVHVEGAVDEHDDCPGDLDGNQSVGVDDLLLVLQAWGTSEETADVTEDGIVDVSDLLVVIGAWGTCN